MAHVDLFLNPAENHFPEHIAVFTNEGDTDAYGLGGCEEIFCNDPRWVRLHFLIVAIGERAPYGIASTCLHARISFDEYQRLISKEKQHDDEP